MHCCCRVAQYPQLFDSIIHCIKEWASKRNFFSFSPESAQSVKMLLETIASYRCSVPLTTGNVHTSLHILIPQNPLLEPQLPDIPPGEQRAK